MSPESSHEIFDRVNNIAPESLYDDGEFKINDTRYVVFEYQTGTGIGLITADEVEQILEKGREDGKTFPLFRGLEASEAYVRKAVEEGEGLMAARIEDGEIYSTGYIIKDNELEGLITFSAD